jgi:hypothetical protein
MIGFIRVLDCANNAPTESSSTLTGSPVVIEIRKIEKMQIQIITKLEHTVIALRTICLSGFEY